MSVFGAEITWKRGDEPFTDNRYSRGHIWRFDGGEVVQASSSPHVVPLPYSVEANVDPEEAFVAALSSCHMLFFLFLAAKKGIVIDSYTDQAAGLMEKVENKTFIARVDLRPQVTYGGDAPSRAVEEELHHKAHELCFIANSVKTVIEVHLD